MDLGWKVLIPLSLGWLLVVAGVLQSRALGDRRRSSSASLRRDAAAVDQGRLVARRLAGASADPFGESRVRPRPCRRFVPNDGRRRPVAMPWPTRAPLLRRFQSVDQAGRRATGDDAVPEGEEAEAPARCTAATCSIATRTAWRSASAASCALRSVRRTASTSVERTTPRTPRSRRESGTASSTRSTICGASTATCASRRARPRRSPNRSSSSSPSRAEPTRSTPRPSSSSTTTAGPQHLPWEDWREGDDRNTSGWMRATVAVGLGGLRRRSAVVGRARLRRSCARGWPVRQAGRRGDREHLDPRGRPEQDPGALRREGPLVRSCSPRRRCLTR